VIVLVAIGVVAAATLLPAGAAHADVAFRKKKPAADSTSNEVAPSGGEAPAATAAAQDSEAPPSDDEAPPAAPKADEFVPQAEDKDRPHDPSLLSQNQADLQAKAKAKKDAGPPIYQRWQFWAITGGVVIGLVAAIWGGSVLIHQANGGDIRPCGMAFADACFGQGR